MLKTQGFRRYFKWFRGDEWILQHLNPAAAQGFARCARFTLGYYHAVGFADWLVVSVLK